MKTLHYLLAGLLSLTLTGCVSFTPSGPIGDPEQKASITQPHAAMLDDVVISDSSIAADLRKNLEAGMSDPALRARMDAAGIEMMSLNPAQTEAFVQAEYTKWTGVIKQAGITADQ